MDKTNKQIIRGIIIPSDWDDHGYVTQIAIATYREDRFLIKDNEPGRKLMALLRKSMIVEGTVIRHGDDQIIEVHQFRNDETKYEQK
jgi:hypothetical protein